MATPYKDRALAHHDKGWAVFPCVPKGKKPMVEGRSGGYKSEHVSREVIEREATRFDKANVGIRLPDDMIGLDLDLRVNDEGHVEADGSAAFETLALPATVTLSHSDVSAYRHHLYRVPDDVSPEDIARLKDSRGGIDLLRWMHRLTVGSGSVHKSGDVYQFCRVGSSERTPAIPRPDQCTQLNHEEWARVVEFFGERSHVDLFGASDVDIEAWLTEHQGVPSPAMKAAVAVWSRRSPDAQRHSTAGLAAYRVAQEAEDGEPGAQRAFVWLRAKFVEAVADRASEAEAEGEWERIAVSAIGKAVAKTESGERDGGPTELVGLTIHHRDRGPVAVPFTELNEEFSDVQVTLRFRHENEGVVWADGVGWLRWSGKRWKPVGESVVGDAVRVWLIEWFAQEIKDGANNERRGKINALMSKPRQERIVRQLKTTEPIEATSLDQHDDLLNCPNGVVDLRTSTLGPHDPALWITKMTRAPYVPGAEHPDWKLSKQSLEPETCDYLLDRLGQAVTGYTPTDHKVVFLTGSGGNGKSTFMDPVRFALGSYAALVPQSILLGASDRHPTELMTLAGVRLAVAEETPEEGRLNIQRLKSITGNSTITAHRMRQDFVEFETQHALFINTNYPPNVVETDHGTWRRLERIVFKRKFRAENARSGMDQSLHQRVGHSREVWTAVLADLVRHAKAYYDNAKTMGPPPAEVAQDTMEWRTDMDPLVEFFTTYFEPDPQSFVTSAELTDALNEFLRERSMHEWAPKLVNTRIEQHEGLPCKVSKDRQRLNAKGFSARFVVSASVSPNQVAVWWGARWVK